jgi:hypothetical protein
MRQDSATANMSNHSKDYAVDDLTNGQYATNNNDDSADHILRQIQTSGTNVTISSELFEKLYLQPKVKDPPGLKHPLQKLFGNPTPL